MASGTARRQGTTAEEDELFVYSFLPGALFVGLMWLISLLSYLTHANLTWLGVLPRSFFGLIGIVTSPLIHDGLVHLLSNSFPLVLLSGFILYMHRPVAGRVLLTVYLASGLLTWLIGRHSYHVGASGVVYGMASYLLFVGLVQRNRGAMAISLAVLFLYSGLFYGLFPTEERISWEGHVAGLLAGLAAALVYGGKTPQPEQAAAKPIEPSVAQRHMSSTAGYHYRHMHVSYTISLPAVPGAATHTYVLNTGTSALAEPTKPVGATSKHKRNQNK